MSDPSQIDQKLDSFRRRLLDLTRRNRLLNYKSTGKRSLPTVQDLQAKLTYTVWLEE